MMSGPLHRITPEIAQKELDEQVSASVNIRYTVKIVGHMAPFCWTVLRHVPGKPAFAPPNCEGEADTYEEALFEAADSARSSEWMRRHKSTVREEDLFEVPLEERADDATT